MNRLYISGKIKEFLKRIVAIVLIATLLPLSEISECISVYAEEPVKNADTEIP